jgi:2-dehydro-3-deoxyglucarate aldolase
MEVINDNITVLVQIESRAGVEAIDDICTVKGIDGIFIGPSDLAAAYGHLGQPLHPEVQEAMAKVFARAKAHGKPVGILAPAETDARNYLEMGATFVAVGSDQGVFRTHTQALRDKFIQA